MCLLLSAVAHSAERPRVQFISDILSQSEMAYGTGMRNLVEEVVKVTAANAEQTEEISKASQAAVRMKMDRSESDLWAVWDEMQVGDEVNQVAFWQAYRKLPNAQLTPERLAPWADGLKKALTAEQYAKWEELAAKKRARIDKAVKSCLDKGREAWITKRSEVRTMLADAMVTVYQLTDAQGTQIRSGVGKVVAEASSSWGSNLERQIRDYVKTAFIGQAEDRMQALENGGINFRGDGDEEARKIEDTAWGLLVKSTLTAEQYSKFQQAEAQKQERRIQSIAQVVVAELDRKLLLSADQRQRLEPLLRRAVLAKTASIEMLLTQGYVNSDMMVGLIREIKEDEVKPILEAEQWLAWKETAARTAYTFDQ